MLNIFQKVYGHKTLNELLASIKGILPSSLSPCGATLFAQIKRANFAAAMRKRAHLQNTCIESPIGHGWLLHQMVWRKPVAWGHLQIPWRVIRSYGRWGWRWGGYLWYKSFLEQMSSLSMKFRKCCTWMCDITPCWQYWKLAPAKYVIHYK